MGPIKRCILSSSLLAATFAAAAQDRKPGLYEVTVTTVTAAPAPSVSPSRTSGACLTQAMIDKYGAIVPENLSNICQLANVVKKPGGMTTDLVCTGPLTGKGTLDVTWTDSEHSTGSIHFSGSMHPGNKEIKIEWSATTKSTYKGPDCGELKPAPAATPQPN
jgi:hypothetical protein